MELVWAASPNTCGAGVLVTDCGDSVCDSSGAPYYYCDGNNLKVKHEGRNRGCSATTNSCFESVVYCNDEPVKACEIDKICSETGHGLAECVPAWTAECGSISDNWIEE